MAPRLRIGFAVGLVALFAWSLFQAQGFRAQARLFPVIIAVVGLSLALVQLGLEVCCREMVAAVSDANPGAAAVGGPGLAEPEVAETESVPPELERRRAAIMLAWIAGFTLGVWLLGFPLTVPIATFAYLRFGAGESWLVSAAFAAAFGATFWALFVYLVRVPFDEGMILTTLWPV